MSMRGSTESLKKRIITTGAAMALGITSIAGCSESIEGGAQPITRECDTVVEPDIASEPYAQQKAAFTAALRMEWSGNDWQATDKSGRSFSGAYLYSDSRWNNYRGYTEARLAPPAVQQAKMDGEIADFVAESGEKEIVPTWRMLGYWAVGSGNPLEYECLQDPATRLDVDRLITVMNGYMDNPDTMPAVPR